MRYIVGFLVAVGLIILAIILIVRGGGDQVPPATTSLTDYTNTSTVMRYTIDTSVTAPQTHHQVQITVGKDKTNINVLVGYDGDVLRTRDYSMTEQAYGVFLRSLQLAGYTEGDSNPALRDERGYCPRSNRYIYQIINQGDELQRYWSTSCGGQGTFRGQASLVRTLFQAQVPDFSRLTSDAL